MSPLLNPGNIIELVSEDYAEGDIVVAQLADGTHVLKVLEGDQLVPLGAGVSYSTSEATILGKAEPSTLTTAELEADGLGWSSVLALTAQTPDGKGTESEPYLIASLANLYWITTSDEVIDHNNESINQANRWAKHYRQTAEDIDLYVSPFNTDDGWSPIGYHDTDNSKFTGSYDGGGFTISNLFINRPNDDYIGLFGYLDSNAVVENVHLVNVHITGNNTVGGLAGYSEGTIKNISVDGNVTGNAKVGGLVGELNGNSISAPGTIEKSSATGTVDGLNTFGGLVGYNYKGTILNSSAEGAITGTGDYVGGLVGSNDGLIDGSFASGDVNGSNTVGGLAGFNKGTVKISHAKGAVSGQYNGVGGLVGENQGTIENSYANGIVTGRDNVGGLVGQNSDNDTIENSYANGTVTGRNNVGGLVGYNNGTIENSYANGIVDGNNYVGGLVGHSYNGTINNSYATGNVTGGDQVGGLVGLNSRSQGSPEGTGTINNSYATGNVSGDSDDSSVGGLVGDNKYGTVTNSFWNTQAAASGVGNDANDTGVTGKTIADIQTLDFHLNTLGWDITGQDGFYPKLGWEINWSANTWCMGTPPAPDNTSGDFGSFDFAFPLGIQNGTGLTTITNQGNAPITPGLITSGSWNDLNQAVAAYQAALVSLENKITTLSPAELALLEVELVIARAAIMALEAKLLAADGKPFNLTSLQAAYAAAVAALNSNQSFLSADQQAAANQLLTAVAGVIAALE